MAGGSDILVVGGGIAGLSAAAVLSRHAQVTVLEAEEQIGFHASGRSATMVHYALGDALVRELTLASRPFFELPPDGFAESPLGQPMPVLVYARDDERTALDALESEIARFATLQRLDEQGLRALCPLLRIGEAGASHGIADHAAIRLDPNALLQGNARIVRANRGTIVSGARVAAIARDAGQWRLESERAGSFCAPILVNAAGAWADAIAGLANVRPIGLRPKRRTIITFDAPADTDVRGLPFAKTVGDELYFAPESGRLFASPMDEVPSDPCDAQPDEYEVALAAHRMAERTIVRVDKIHSRWAGLRSFTPDRHPAAGWATDAEGFFWLAGQGGFGLQTSPAMARIAESLIAGSRWPIGSISPQELSPGRFVRQPA